MSVKLDRKTQFKVVLCLIALLLQAANAFPATVFEPLDLDIRRDATVRAVEAVLPSVVNIATATIVEYRDPYDDLLRQFYGRDRRPPRTQERINSIGSGIIIDEDGYILTNLHVLERASRAQVKLWNGGEYEVESQFVASRESDIALLKLRKKSPDEKFKAIKFAPDDDLLLGETVIALGNPFGLGGSVSRGILSSKNRRPPVEDEPLNVQDWLQTDAAINPGNSGGPLINLRGELIGVNNAKGMGQGIGFAIPVKQVLTALSEALSPESTDALWFGARVRPENGALKISSVQPGSPADKAGLRDAQEVLQVDGSAVKTMLEFNRSIVNSKDHRAALQLQQGADTHVVTVQLVPFDNLIQQKLGLVLLTLTPETAATFNISAGKGLFIQEVEKDSPADKVQLQKGYLLTGIDGRSADNLMAVAGVLSAKKSGDNAQLSVVVPRRLSGNFVEFRQGTVNLQLR